MKTVEIKVSGKCATHYISEELIGELTIMEKHLQIRETKRELLREDKTMYVILEKMNYTTFLYFVLENDFQELSKNQYYCITFFCCYEQPGRKIFLSIPTVVFFLTSCFATAII